MNGWRLRLRVRRVDPDGALVGQRLWVLAEPRPRGFVVLSPGQWRGLALAAAAVLFVLAPLYFAKVAMADSADDNTPVSNFMPQDVVPQDALRLAAG